MGKSRAVIVDRARLDAVAPYRVVAEVPCSNCGTLCWLGAEASSTLMANGGKPVCRECMGGARRSTPTG